MVNCGILLFTILLQQLATNAATKIETQLENAASSIHHAEALANSGNQTLAHQLADCKDESYSDDGSGYELKYTCSVGTIFVYTSNKDTKIQYTPTIPTEKFVNIVKVVFETDVDDYDRRVAFRTGDGHILGRLKNNVGEVVLRNVLPEETDEPNACLGIRTAFPFAETIFVEITSSLNHKFFDIFCPKKKEKLRVTNLVFFRCWKHYSLSWAGTLTFDYKMVKMSGLCDHDIHPRTYILKGPKSKQIARLNCRNKPFDFLQYTDVTIKLDHLQYHPDSGAYKFHNCFELAYNTNPSTVTIELDIEKFFEQQWNRDDFDLSSLDNLTLAGYSIRQAKDGLSPSDRRYHFVDTPCKKHPIDKMFNFKKPENFKVYCCDDSKCRSINPLDPPHEFVNDDSGLSIWVIILIILVLLAMVSCCAVFIMRLYVDRRKTGSRKMLGSAASTLGGVASIKNAATKFDPQSAFKRAEFPGSNQRSRVPSSTKGANYQTATTRAFSRGPSGMGPSRLPPLVAGADTKTHRSGLFSRARPQQVSAAKDTRPIQKLIIFNK